MSLTTTYSMDCYTRMSSIILEQEFNSLIFNGLFYSNEILILEQRFYSFYS
jgi:hypothetical protein